MVREAKLENGVPQTEGWFVVNARDSRWVHNELGVYCGFEGEGEAGSTDLGVNLNVLPPASRWRCTTRRRARRRSSSCAASAC